MSSSADTRVGPDATAFPAEADIPAKPTLRARLRQVDLRPAAASSALFLLAFVYLQVIYARYDFRTLMGDDLDLFVRSNMPDGYASSFWQSFSQTGSDKYRPVVTPMLAVATDALGPNFGHWFTVNSALLAINALLVGVLAWRLSGHSRAITLAAVLVACSSRFASYFVLQGYGIMENTALAMTLLALLGVSVAWEQREAWPLVAASGAFLLSVYAHERYIVLGAFLVTAAVLAPWAMTVPRRIGLAAIPVAVAFSNYAIKTWLVGVDFFTGGGGQTASTDLAQIRAFMTAALANTLGYNEGPAYLSGLDATGLGTQSLLVAAMMAVPAAAIVLVHLTRARAWGGLRPVLLALSLYGPLLLSASITFRQEYRWLYAPFLAVVLGLAWTAGRLRADRSRIALLPLVALLGAFAVDGFYRPFLPNTYYFGGQKSTDSVLAEVVLPHRSELDERQLVLVTNGQAVFRDWYLRSGAFFNVYAPGAGTDLLFVETPEQVPPTAPGRPSPLVFEFVGDRVVPLPAR